MKPHRFHFLPFFAALLFLLVVVFPHHHHAEGGTCFALEWCEEDGSFLDEHTSHGGETVPCHHHAVLEDAAHGSAPVVHSRADTFASFLSGRRERARAASYIIICVCSSGVADSFFLVNSPWRSVVASRSAGWKVFVLRELTFFNPNFPSHEISFPLGGGSDDRSALVVLPRLFA